jgi:hypothetical protein
MIETGIYTAGLLAGFALALIAGALFAVGYAAFAILRRVVEP